MLIFDVSVKRQRSPGSGPYDIMRAKQINRDLMSEGVEETCVGSGTTHVLLMNVEMYFIFRFVSRIWANQWVRQHAL